MTETGGPPWPDELPPTVPQPPVGGPGPVTPPAGGSGSLPPTYPPAGPPPTPWHKQPWPYFVAAAIVLALALILYFALRDDDDGEVTPSTTTTSSTTLVTTTTLAPTTTLAATTTAAPTTTVAPTTTLAPTTAAPTTTVAPTTTTTAPFTFTDGTHPVGAGNGEVPPGRYVASTGTGSDCTWERLEGQTVLGQGEARGAGQAVIDVLDSDGSFESQGCGRWTGYVAPQQQLTQLGSGQYIVGAAGTGQIAPGSYRTNGGADCTWARLEAFTGDPDAVIASGDATASFTVTLAASDVGFSSTGCPGWTKV